MASSSFLGSGFEEDHQIQEEVQALRQFLPPIEADPALLGPPVTSSRLESDLRTCEHDFRSPRRSAEGKEMCGRSFSKSIDV